MTNALIRQAAESVAILVETMFFEAARGGQIAGELRARVAAGALDLVKTPQELADTLTSIIQRIENDRHLHVRFDPRRAFERLLTADEVRAATRDGERGLRRLPPAHHGDGIRAVGLLEANVGYIRLESFRPRALAGADFSAAMRRLQNVDAMIVDLRENRGGAQEMVAYVCSYFFPAGNKLLLTSRFRDAEPRSSTTVDVPGKRMEDIPLYVVTSRSTFSAAEAFAYILQKFGRATVVGEVTPGGGRHNAVVGIGGGLQASISVSDVVHPQTGSSWQGTGVVPDVAVEAEHALDAAHTLAREKLKAIRRPVGG
jgi:retinol-binding protein 3